MEEYSGTGSSYTKYFFAGGAYEIEVVGENTTVKRYYSIAGMMVAMDNGTSLVYFAQDHLSSTSLVMDDEGGLLSQTRYMPFGEVREISGVTNITETDFGYTGQRNLEDIGLMDYDARFYSPTLGRFLQPDTIVPEPGNPQAWNRYSYVNNNPLIYTDPTGHFLNVLIGAGIGALVGGIRSAISQKITTGSVDMKEVAKAAAVGAVAGAVA
jgi:RHS repeat-associated protein